MKKLSLADSALNRLLNFMDELDAPIVSDSVAQGEALEAALMQRTPDMPPAEGIDAALVLKGLNLAPIA